MSDEIEQKQQFLRSEIMDKGFDADSFSNFMISEKGENALQLENWTFEELQNVVYSFQQMNSTNQNDNNVQESNNINENNNQIQQENFDNNNNENYNNNNNNENYNNNNENYNNNNDNYNNENYNNNNDNNNNEKKFESDFEIVSKKEEKINYSEIINELITPSKPKEKAKEEKEEKEDPSSPFNKFCEIIDCRKFDETKISNTENLEITIKNLEQVKTGFLSLNSYYKFTMETPSMNFSTERKVSDLEWLNKKLIELYPGKIISNFPQISKENTKKKLIYLNLYINSLAENNFVRQSQIFFDFLSLSQKDFNKKKNDVYDKLKTPEKIFHFFSEDGKITLKFSKENVKKINLINNDVNKKTNAFEKLHSCLNSLNNNFNVLIKNFDDLSVCFKNLGNVFDEKVFCENNSFKKGFEILEKLAKNFSKGFEFEKNFFKNDLKYFFQFMKKEISDVNKIYDEFKITKECYVEQFNKVNKLATPNEKENKQLLDFKTLFAFRCESLLNEYEKLIERQKIRLGKNILKSMKNNQDFIEKYLTWKV